MHSVLYDRHGSPDVLLLREVPTPSTGRGKVILRVATWDRRRNSVKSQSINDRSQNHRRLTPGPPDR